MSTRSEAGGTLLPVLPSGLTTILEMNCVRKHLSAIKGGRLGAACAPARLVTLMISDVPGDDPAVIASGPTVPDPTTCAEALAIVQKYAILEPRAVIEHLRRGDDESPQERRDGPLETFPMVHDTRPSISQTRFQLTARPQSAAPA